VIVTVDAVNGSATLAAHDEALKQGAVADRILLTKTDLAGTAAVTALRRDLHAINPGAPILVANDGGVDPALIFNIGLYDPNGKTMDVRRWLNAELHAAMDHHDPSHHGHAHDRNRHDARVQAHCVTIDEPVDWAAFSYWLELLAAMRGENMLRVKGIVAIDDRPERPIVIHGVQHVFHPPVWLDEWPSADRRTRLVFITRDMPRALIELTLRKFGRVRGDETAALAASA
jgi:G3E family GTPase